MMPPSYLMVGCMFREEENNNVCLFVFIWSISHRES